jgi:hypothetical protein
VQNIKIYLTTKISCQAGHSWLLGRIPEALVGHVRPSSLSLVNQVYPAPYPGSRELTRTCSAPAQTCPASSPYPPPYPGSRELTQTCQAPSLDMSSLSALSDSLSGFLRPNPNMSSPQPRHVWPLSLIPGYPRLIQLLSQVPEMVVEHVRPPTQTCLGFWHSMARFPWGAIKGPPRLSNRVGHSV